MVRSASHFYIAIQLIEGSNLKFTDYLSRIPVGGATPEDNYDEEYVINILSEQAKLNLKYGQFFADQSNNSKHVTEAKNDRPKSIIEQRNNQSQSNRTFENKNGVNKIFRSEKNTSGQSDISTSKSSCPLKQHFKRHSKEEIYKIKSGNYRNGLRQFLPLGRVRLWK